MVWRQSVEVGVHERLGVAAVEGVVHEDVEPAELGGRLVDGLDGTPPRR